MTFCLRVCSSQGTFSTPKYDAPSGDLFYDLCSTHHNIKSPFLRSFLSQPIFSVCQCSGMLFRGHKQAMTLLPLSCHQPCGDLLHCKGERSHLLATTKISASLLLKIKNDPRLDCFISLPVLWSKLHPAQDACGMSINIDE